MSFTQKPPPSCLILILWGAEHGQVQDAKPLGHLEDRILALRVGEDHPNR